MTGPTVEGSIVAKVKADISNLEENVTRAQAKVEELTGKKVEVKVDAQVTESLAKLKAVEAEVNKVAVAEGRLAVAERASQNAASQSYLANLRLEAELGKRGRTELSVAAATEALARADRNAEAAELRHAAATTALTAAQARLRAVQDAAPPDNPQQPTPAAGNGNAAPAGFMMAAVIAVALLVPLAAALAGYIGGATGALAGMGAAAVLAGLGMKNAITAGTAAGNIFSAGLHVLKGNLDELAATSANTMLPQFMLAVQTINTNMPSLNGEIRVFSGLLGTTGNIVLSTLISGFKVLLPLFTQAGIYVNQIAVGFQKWTTNGGLALWARDASVALPQVAQALGSLLNGVLSLLGALQPLGTVMLGLITIIGNVVSGLTSLLGPAFAPVVAGTLAAVGAFQLFTNVPAIVSLVTKAVTALGISADVALGPIGWVAAGIAAIAAIALTSSVATNAAATAMNNYTAAVQQDNGVIGEHVAAQAASNLQTSGAFELASKLGIAQKTLTDATLGQAGAQHVLETRIAALNAQLAIMDQAVAKGEAGSGAQAGSAAQLADEIQKLSQQYIDNNNAIVAQIKAYNDIASAQGLATIQTQDQLQAQNDLAASYGASLPVYLGAVAANKQAATQLQATTEQFVLQSDAAGLLTQAFQKINDKSLSVAQAQTSLATAGNTVTSAFSKNGDAIDGSSAAALANQQAIQSQVLAAQAAADAIGKQTGSTIEGTKAYTDSKASLEAALQAQGDLNPAVQDYINKLYDIQNFKVLSTKIDIDAAVATQQLQNYINMLASLPGYSAAARAAGINLSTDGHLVYSDARNTSVAGHADGGTISGVGSSTSDSNVRRLSVGEEVIKASSASQVRPLLKAINRNPADAIAAFMNQKQTPSAGKVIQFGDIYQQPGTTITETMQAAGFLAGQIA